MYASLFFKLSDRTQIGTNFVPFRILKKYLLFCERNDNYTHIVAIVIKDRPLKVHPMKSLKFCTFLYSVHFLEV